MFFVRSRDLLKMLCGCCAGALQRRHADSGSTPETCDAGSAGGTTAIDDDLLYAKLRRRHRIGRARLRRALPFDPTPSQFERLSQNGLSIAVIHMHLKSCVLFPARALPRLLCLNCACRLISKRLVAGIAIGEERAFAVEARANHSLKHFLKYT